MDLSDVAPSDIEILQLLFESDNNAVFLVNIYGAECVMKVYHHHPPRSYTPLPLSPDTLAYIAEMNARDEAEGRSRPPPPSPPPTPPTPPGLPRFEKDNFARELSAYKRLKECGVCDRGIVPQFYGVLRALDVSQFEPHLESFKYETQPPDAMFLEYIPNMQVIEPKDYTEERMKSLIHGMEEIYKALVVHNDINARNVMIFEDDPARVLWIDFDQALTLEDGDMNEQERTLLENCVVEAKDMAECLKIDYDEGGEINESGLFYWRS